MRLRSIMVDPRQPLWTFVGLGQTQRGGGELDGPSIYARPRIYTERQADGRP